MSTSLLEIMEGVSASILQSAQNVKVKLLSIITGVSTKLLLTYLQNPLPLPQQFKWDPLGKRGLWVGVNLVKCRGKKKKKKKKKRQPNLSLNNTVRKLAS